MIKRNEDGPFFVAQNDLPKGFIYPASYHEAILKNEDLTPWFFLTASEQIAMSQSLNVRYPKRNLHMFAKREDCDDIACWDLDNLPKVALIHDFASEGYEFRKSFDDFDSWYKAAVEDSKTFNDN